MYLLITNIKECKVIEKIPDYKENNNIYSFYNIIITYFQFILRLLQSKLNKDL